MRACKRGLPVAVVVAVAIAAAPSVASAAWPNYLVDPNGDPVPVGTEITAEVTTAGFWWSLFAVIPIDACDESELHGEVVQNEWEDELALIGVLSSVSLADCDSGAGIQALHLPWCLNVEDAIDSNGRVGVSVGYRDTTFDDGEPCGDFDIEIGQGLGKWKGKLIDGVNGGAAAWHNPNTTQAQAACGADRALIRFVGAWEFARYDPSPQGGGTVTADYCVTEVDGQPGGELYVADG